MGSDTPNQQHTAAAGQPRVFVSRKIPAAGLSKLRDVTDCAVWKRRMPPSRAELLDAVRGCDGLLTLLSDRIDAEVMDAAGPQLRVVSNYAVGVNNIDLREAARRGISVGNTPDVLTDATADIAVALMLAAARQMLPALESVRDGDWRTWEPTGLLGCDLVGRTLGIVGMGRIGSAVARRLGLGWGMRLLYTARGDKQVDGLPEARRVPLDQLLAESDFVSLHTDLNDQTCGMINRRRLSLMKPTAVLVNTSRGGVIDQHALVEALTEGRPMAAGLDVTEPEPIPPDHPLVGLSNCIILPHIGSATVATRDAMAQISVDNLLAGLAGRPLPCPVVAPSVTT